MSREPKQHSTGLDRREFIVAVGAVAIAYLPLSAVVQAVPAVGTTQPQVLLDDWTIDDMWGVYPRPSEAIGYGRPREDGELRAAIDPIDAGFLV